MDEWSNFEEKTQVWQWRGSSVDSVMLPLLRKITEALGYCKIDENTQNCAFYKS